MSDVDFDFKQKFTCLKENKFISINGVTRLKKFRTNDLVGVGYKGRYVLDAIVLQFYKTKISDFSIKKLNEILSTADRQILSYKDAIEVINLDRPYGKLKSEDDYISVWYLGRNEAVKNDFIEAVKDKLGE